MFTLTAAALGDDPTPHLGQTVEFPDFHGRTITGPLDKATNPPTAAYATLTVNGRTRTVFKNTPVTVMA